MEECEICGIELEEEEGYICEPCGLYVCEEHITRYRGEWLCPNCYEEQLDYEFEDEEDEY